MNFGFRPARRSEAKPLVGMYSESGCGKTYSALLLARGFVGAKGTIGMVETESGRGEAYADCPEVAPYMVQPIRENFSPTNYGGAIDAAEQAELNALIIDSASHEWEGLGGVLDMAAKNQAENKKGPRIWQQPKIDHQKQFMLRLLQTPIDLVIVCMRAKYCMEQVTVNGKKEWQRSTSLSPKQSEDILFEMFVHGWIDASHNWHGTKYTRPELRDVFRDGTPISVETGKRLADWSKGKDVEPASKELKTAMLAISSATNMEQLTAAGSKIKEAGLSKADARQAKDAYKARADNLRGVA